jgi:serine O-acetyltransferase
MADAADSGSGGGRAGGQIRLRSVLGGPDFILSARRLWLLAMALHASGHRFLARWVKNLNSVLYNNSLPGAVIAEADVRLGHHGSGVVLHPNVTLGREVKIYQGVTMFVRPQAGSSNRIIVGDDVVIGANAVVLTPRNRDLRIGRGARIGAGAVVTDDIPPYTTAVPQPVRLLPRGSKRPDRAEQDVNGRAEPAPGEQGLPRSGA